MALVAVSGESICVCIYILMRGLGGAGKVVAEGCSGSNEVVDSHSTPFVTSLRCCHHCRCTCNCFFIS